MTVAQSHPRHTIAEYVRREANATDKHEYHDGEILAMSGGSPEHSLINANTIAAINARLKGKPCRVYDANLRIRVPFTVRYLYSDASIFCAPLDYDPDDPSHQSVSNPRVIIEVLSPTTEGYDRGDKFAHYRQLPALQEYVLISQPTPLVETFFRREGNWLFTPFSGPTAAASLRSIEVDLPMAEIYAGIEFPPVPPQTGLA